MPEGDSLCLGCGARNRRSTHYLCRDCWYALPEETRRRLNLHDDCARDRLFQLFAALRRAVPLDVIEVSER